MEFIVSTTGSYYDEDKMQKLQALGFTFTKSDIGGWCIKGSGKVEIDSIQDLIDFTNEWGRIVFHKDEIEIYDDYRE